MGIYHLLGVRPAVFFISSLRIYFFLFFLAIPLISFAQQSVDVVRNPTTSYFEVGPRTINTPSGFSSASRDITPYVSKTPSGGLNQGMPSDVIIDATKQKSPFTPNLKAGSSAVKGAAIRCIQSFRCNAATLAGSVGLELLFSQMNWDSLPDGSLVEEISNPYPTSPPLPVTYQTNTICYNTDFHEPGWAFMGGIQEQCPQAKNRRACQINPSAGRYLQAGTLFTCYYTSDPNYSTGTSQSPVPPSSVVDAVNDHYDPQPSDWPTLTRDIDLSDPDVIIEIPSIPSIETPPITTTKKDSSGAPVSVDVEETRYDISVRPGTNDSKKPALDVDKTTTTTTYDPNNETVSSSTTSSTMLGGDPVPSSVNIDIPTDCAFMPTVCAFIDWVKDMGTEEEPDLSVLLTDQDYEQTYTISFGSETCPDPIEINIAFLDQTVQLSYEPACDFVGYARPFILISAYIFAIYIGLGVARNG